MSRENFRSYIVQQYGTLPPPPPGATPRPPAPAAPTPTAPATDTLPDFKRANDIVAGNIRLPELLIADLLHRQCKMILSGGSKSFKSWTLMDLAICLCWGLPWWGLATRPSNIIFLNFELITGFFEERVLSLCRARNCTPPGNFIYWNLRGYCYDLAILAKVLIARLSALNYPIDAIFVDPLYKAYGDLDENSATDMNQMMILVEQLGTHFGASVIFGAHHAKGNAAGKDSKDRMSGSGVLGRDPDVILDMTRHKVDDAYVVESQLRYLPRLSPFVVRWNFPIMQPDESLDPRQLYTPGATEDQSGATTGPAVFSEADVLECLPLGGAQDTLWRKMVALKFGKSGQAFYDAKMALLRQKLVHKDGTKFWKVKLNLQPT